MKTPTAKPIKLSSTLQIPAKYSQLSFTGRIGRIKTAGKTKAKPLRQITNRDNREEAVGPRVKVVTDGSPFIQVAVLPRIRPSLLFLSRAIKQKRLTNRDKNPATTFFLPPAAARPEGTRNAARSFTRTWP